MILLTTKSVIAIYRVNKHFLIWSCFLLASNSDAANEISSFCFDKTVKLAIVREKIDFLLTPKDIVTLRPEESCLDIIISPDREKLFEKYLSKSYALRRNSDVMKNENLRPLDLDCRLDFKKTEKKKIVNKSFKIGEKIALDQEQASNDSASTVELLLGSGKKGEVTIGAEVFEVSCQPLDNDNDKANVVFSYLGKNKSNISSQVLLKKGEWANIASVLKDLNEKKKGIDIPVSEITQHNEKIETEYELQFK